MSVRMTVSLSVVKESAHDGDTGYYAYRNAELDFQGSTAEALDRVKHLLKEAWDKVEEGEEVMSEAIYIERFIRDNDGDNEVVRCSTGE